MANAHLLTVQHFPVVWQCSVINNLRSPLFRIEQRSFELQFLCGFGMSDSCRLRLHNEETPPEPFDLSVYVVMGHTLMSHCTTTVRKKEDNVIWEMKNLELLNIVPEFTKGSFVFLIVFYGSASPLEKGTRHMCVQTPKARLDNLQRISLDLSKLLKEDDSSADVTLKCGDRTWKAHRSLLSCRSTKLHQDMLECATGEVELQGIEADLVEQFLHHLYTGELPNLTMDSAMRFYEIAILYSVGLLKDMCASFLTENLTREDACAILSLPEQHNYQELRQIVISYFLKEKIPLDEDYWSTFNEAYVNVANDIMIQFVRLHIPK